MGLCCQVTVTFPREELTKKFESEVHPGDWETQTPLCLDTYWNNTRGVQLVEDTVVDYSLEYPQSLFTYSFSYLDVHPEYEGDWDVTHTYEYEGGDIIEHTIHYHKANLGEED